MEHGRKVGRRMTDSVQIGWLHVLSGSKQDFHHTLWYCEKDPPPRRYDPDSKCRYIVSTVVMTTNKGISGE